MVRGRAACGGRNIRLSGSGGEVPQILRNVAQYRHKIDIDEDLQIERSNQSNAAGLRGAVH
jgi:hypothetical protein